MSKGLVYTTFAITATSLLILLITVTAVDSNYTSDANPYRIGQASFYHQNVEEDLRRAYRIAFQRGASGTVNYIIETGNETDRPVEALRNATVNGTINGYRLNNTENATLKDWNQRVKQAASNSRYYLSINYTSLNVEDNYTRLQTRMQARIILKDPVTLAEFNRTREYSQRISVKGLEDPMLLLRSQGRYVNKYKPCKISYVAEHRFTGLEYNQGTTYGEPEIVTDDNADLGSIDNASTKILITDNATPYTINNLNSFAGIISEQGLPGTSADYSTKYIYNADTGTVNSFDTDTRVIMYDDEAWNSNIRKIVNSGCYLNSTVSDPGPGFLERMQNRLQASAGEAKGLETLVDKQEIPSQIRVEDESNVGYKYFRPGQNTEKIAGVTGDRRYSSGREYRPNFRLDQQHIQEWGLEDLSYQ
ncbi:MAG: hypothetical protein ABEJ93_00060 [Candidatus Nanohalobium sp.]